MRVNRIRAMDNLNTVVSVLLEWAERAERLQQTATHKVDEEAHGNEAKNYRALVFLIREGANAAGIVLSAR